MLEQKARQRRRLERAQRNSPPRRRLNSRKLIAIIGIMLLLSLSGSMLAMWRAARVDTKANTPPASSPVSAPSPSPLGLSKEYIYAGGKLVATEEPVNSGGPLSAPASLIATPASASHLNLSWAASTGPVASYQIERRQNINSPYTVLSANPTTNSFNDTSVSPGTAYLYRVRATDGAGNFSPYSNVDLATAVSFTDAPLVSAVTIIKAQHLVELRQSINAVRTLAGLGATAWTDSSLQGIRIKAIHLEEMRTSLDQALTTLNLPVQSYTDSSLTGSRVKQIHIEELRERVK